MMYILNKKKIVILLIVTLSILSSFSVGYALINQKLSISGSFNVLASPSGLAISSISTGTFTYSAAETSNSTKSGTTASFGLSFPKGSSTASYNITIKNNGTSKVRFSKTNFTSSNSAFTYVITGITTSTILDIGDEVTVNVKIQYTSEYKYSVPTTTTSNITINFDFVSTSREVFTKLTGTVSPNTGDLSTNDTAKFIITINNPNNFPITYTLEGENGFVVYNSNGEIGTYYLSANGSDSYEILISDTTDSIAESTTASVNILAKVEDYDASISNTIGTVTLKLKEKNKYVVIGGAGGIKVTPDDIDYSNTDSSSSGIYAAKDGDGYTYYYRGTITNNYFSFASYTWRILRIDKNGHVRLILNDYIRNSSGSIVTKAYKSTYTASSQSAADTLVKLVNDTSDSSVNSPIYGSINSTDTTNLRGWYNTNLKQYEDYIVDSKFCQDTEGGYTTGSSTSSTVYYYGAYQRIGKDTAIYSPDFSCRDEDTLIEKIGLLSSDEFVFAGGAFLQGNNTIFLNDFGGTSIWWTLSPAYYDSNQSKVGVFNIAGDGSLTDWIDTNTIANAEAIRPVITVNGNLIVSGEGTSTDPYHFN